MDNGDHKRARPRNYDSILYYISEQLRNKDYHGSDFLICLNVDSDKGRQGCVVWEEDGRYPDVIIGLMSPNTASVDQGTKKELDEKTFRTCNYIYNPKSKIILTSSSKLS